MSEVSRILLRAEAGDELAIEELFPLVYDELRRIAGAQLVHETLAHSLQATALVHEAYLRLVDVAASRNFKNRRYFFGAAAEAMRRILIDAERQALALMDHPNIAKVYDGGMTDQGRPFFAMEYVKGMPLTEYCDQMRLPVEERLKLFVPICQAVQHAHQKGIIHRDLKPSNVIILLVRRQARAKSHRLWFGKGNVPAVD